MKEQAFMAPILAASTLALSSLAHADTTVTLDQGKVDLTVYGIADVSVTTSNSGNGYKTRFDGGGVMQASRLGFRASRTFADGIKVFAILEGGVQFNNGSYGGPAPTLGSGDTAASSSGQPGTGSRIFARQSLAGLSGPLGSLSLGRQYAGSYFAGAGLGSAWGDGFYTNPSNILANVGGMPLRVDNSLVYTSPTIGGASAMVTLIAGTENNVKGPVVNGATTVTDKSGRGVDVFLRYTTGALRLGVTGWSVYKSTYATVGETGLARGRGWQVVADYDFGFAYVALDYAQGKVGGGNYENVTKALSDSHGWYLGARVPFGENNRHSVMVGYDDLTDESQLHRSAKLYGASYWYQLEVNTRLYASYGTIRNSANASYALIDAGNNVGNITSPGTRASGFEMGLNYNF